MAAEKKTDHTVLVNFYHNSKLLLRAQNVKLSAEEAAPLIADKLVKPAK